MDLGVNGAFGIANMVVPAGGPKIIPINVDFTAVSQLTIDGTQVVNQGKIEYLQGVYIDNSANLNPLSLTMSTTGQVITAKKQTQGYYPILVPNPPQIIAATTQGIIIPLFFYNIPISPCVWSVV